jgi:DNA topoisomerase IB
MAAELDSARAVEREQYLHPGVLPDDGDGLLGTVREGAKRKARGAGLGGLETRVMRLLKQRAA